MMIWEEKERISDLDKGRFAIRASKLISMAGEKAARGKDLFRNLSILDNALLLIENSFISYVGPYKKLLSRSWKEIDLGDTVIMPALVNAHTHLQLSWLEGQCLFKRGFTAWLADMIPKLLSLLNGSSQWGAEKCYSKLEKVIKNLKNCGSAYIGDVGGSIPGEILHINKLARASGIEIHNFCEHFGFSPLEKGEVWPPRCREEMREYGELEQSSSPCGHALYSTSLDKLCKIKAFCKENGKVFSMHLAESLEEEQALAEGDGPLWNLYYDNVIPKDWQPYGMRPYAAAKKAGLVDEGSLFIHGVHLNNEEIKDLADCGAAICLCPRSNVNLDTGKAPVRAYIEKGARICLGTDGLSSNSDLNVFNELLYYREKEDLPFSCLLRLCTINGLDALGNKEKGWLVKGARARFSLADMSLLH